MKNLNFPGLSRALVVSEDERISSVLRSVLQSEGVVVEVAASLEAAGRRLVQRSFDLVFLDEAAARGGIAMALPNLRLGAQPADVVLISSAIGSNEAITAMRGGIAEVIEQPVDAGRVLATARRCMDVRQLRSDLARVQDRIAELTATELIGLSPAMRELQARIVDVAAGPDAPVAIVGEAGSGKEMVARRLHASSARRHGPFVTVNCAAMSESQLEVELFGHEPGALSDRRDGRTGTIAMAEGGTLFLDEITGTSLAVQARIHRLLHERTYRRVGGLEDHPADVRIVIATVKNLRAEVDGGRFREDLFLRLNVATIDVPPLRERPEDVPLLAHYFLDRIGRQIGKHLTGFTEEAIETLCEYEWFGNVRELANVIEHAAIICKGGMIEENHLPKFTGGLPDGSDLIERNTITLDSIDCSIRSLEEQLCRKVLDQTRWNISKAASMLGINRTTLYNKIRLYQIGERPERLSIDS